MTPTTTMTMTMTPTPTMTTTRLVTVRAFVDHHGYLRVEVHPCYPTERARRATPSERAESRAASEEGWIEAQISARTLARLEAQAEG